MMYLKMSGQTLLLSALFIFSVLSSNVFSENVNQLALSKKVVSLSETDIENKLQLRIKTNNPKEFHLTLSAPTASNAGGQDKFKLTPTIPEAGGHVILIMDLPYKDQSTNGLLNPASINRVKNNYREKASDAFSLCPESKKICKPLKIRVDDDATAIPGIVYTTTLTVYLSDSTGESTPQRITIKYKKDGDAIGIHTRDNTLYLNSRNGFSTSTDICIFSPVYKGFDIALNTDHRKGKNFALLGRTQKQLLPYIASVALDSSLSSVTTVTPQQWVANGRIISAKNGAECGARNNARIYLDIDPDEILQSTPDKYDGILTIRVKAK